MLYSNRTSPPLLRVASASGAVTDRRHGFKSLSELEDIQFIVGDWMSEMNMTARAASKIDNNGTSDEFEAAFLEGIEPALPNLQSKGIKVAVNAGASDAQKLCNVLTEKIKSQGLDLQVAWIGGDEVIDIVRQDARNGSEFQNLTTGKQSSKLSDSLLNIDAEQVKSFLIGTLSPYTRSVTSAAGALLKHSKAARTSSFVVVLRTHPRPLHVLRITMSGSVETFKSLPAP